MEGCSPAKAGFAIATNTVGQQGIGPETVGIARFSELKSPRAFDGLMAGAHGREYTD